MGRPSFEGSGFRVLGGTEALRLELCRLLREVYGLEVLYLLLGA